MQNSVSLFARLPPCISLILAVLECLVTRVTFKSIPHVLSYSYSELPILIPFSVQSALAACWPTPYSQQCITL